MFDNIYRHGFARVAVCVPRVHVADPEANADGDLAIWRAGRMTMRRRSRCSRSSAFPPTPMTTCFFRMRCCRRRAGAARAIIEASRELMPGPDRRRALRAARPAVQLRLRHPSRARCSASCRRPICRIIANSTRSAISPPAGSQDGRSVPFAGREVPFGTRSRCSAHPTCADFVIHVEICEDVWTPAPPSSYGAMAGATVLANLSASNITVGKAQARRAAVPLAIGALHRGLSLFRGGAGRIDHRSRLGRPGRGVRESASCSPKPSASRGRRRSSRPISISSGCARSACASARGAIAPINHRDAALLPQRRLRARSAARRAKCRCSAPSTAIPSCPRTRHCSTRTATRLSTSRCKG